MRCELLSQLSLSSTRLFLAASSLVPSGSNAIVAARGLLYDASFACGSIIDLNLDALVRPSIEHVDFPVEWSPCKVMVGDPEV